MSEIHSSETGSAKNHAPVLTELPVEFPLHYFHGQVSGETHNGLLVQELAFRGFLNIRANPQDVKQMKAMSSVLGVTVPVAPCTRAESGGFSIHWLGPDEWLVVAPGGEQGSIEAALRKSMKGHISVVDVSGGLTLLRLSGKGVDVVMKKSSVYDFHPRNFGSGKSVQTTFAKAGAIVSQSDEGSFDLVIRRSFADYIARWLLDAGEEFGCRIEVQV